MDYKRGLKIHIENKNFSFWRVLQILPPHIFILNLSSESWEPGMFFIENKADVLNTMIAALLNF